jgi:hypothetical protein
MHANFKRPMKLTSATLLVHGWTLGKGRGGRRGCHTLETLAIKLVPNIAVEPFVTARWPIVVR